MHASDWSQFRGPTRHGRSDEQGLAREWSSEGPRELWRRPIGAGYSAAAVADGVLYTMASSDGEEEVLALDAATGEVRWRHPVGASKASDLDDTGPRSTPAVVEGRVHTVSSAGVLVALDTSGAELWRRPLMDPEQAPRFGYSVSPLVDRGLVIVEAGATSEEPGVRAYDAATGELRWEALEGPAGYSSPVAVEIDGTPQYLLFRRAGAEVVSLGAEGEVLWRHATDGLAIITSPIFLPPDRVFVATADDAMGGLMLEVTRGESGWEVAEAWGERLMRNHFNSAVAVGGALYGFDNGTLRCLDAAAGEKLWARRGLGKGSLIAADDRLFVLGDDGTLVLVETTRDGYREHGRVQAMSGRAWTAPALADGRLFVRDFDEIVAYDVRERDSHSEAASSDAAQGGAR